MCAFDRYKKIIDGHLAMAKIVFLAIFVHFGHYDWWTNDQKILVFLVYNKSTHNNNNNLFPYQTQ